MKSELVTLLTEKQSRLARTRLARYRPYAKQSEFHAAGARHRERLFMAGNQLGKGIGGLTQLIGLFAGASDRRLKTDIRRVGTTDGGSPIYVYRYKSGGPFHMGVMAQEERRHNPDAVSDMPGGFLAVDYSKVN